jgi:hypothetical protein
VNAFDWSLTLCRAKRILVFRLSWFTNIRMDT